MTTDKEIRAQTVPAFRFVVSIGRRELAAFTECTLPVIEWEVEQIKEGGLNMMVHQLPGRRKAAKVSLKNGIGTYELLEWYLKAMKGDFKRIDMTIALRNSTEPVITWEISQALPTRWTGPQLQAGANSIAIQTLELACGEVSVSYIEPKSRN
jgi:phage tail-like protein